MEKNFEVGGRKFQLNKINAFKQLHIVRRVAPILGDMLPAMQGMDLKALKGDQASRENLDNIVKFLSPIFTGLSKLSDQDCEVVFLGLLSSVEVQQPAGNWAKVATDQMLMMQDLELPVLIQIAGHAFMFNLANFFGALPQK